MNLNIRSGIVGYNNKILMSDSGFRLGKNGMVNTSALSHKRTTIVPKHVHKTSIFHAPSKHTSAITHKDENIALVPVLTGGGGGAE